MAINALGLPLQLQATPLQLQDLLQGLQPGDLIKGRIVELLPQAKAVVSLRGQNVVAQLPPPPPGNRAFAKGDQLQLQVLQADPQPGPAPRPATTAGAAPAAPAPQSGAQQAGTAPTPVLTLRLLPTATLAIPQVADPASSAALPAPQQLTQALAGAGLPPSQPALRAAEALVRQGAPLDPATLQAVVRTAEALLAAEAPAPPLASAPPLPEPVRAALSDALPALKWAAAQPAPGRDNVALRQAAQVIESALQSNALAPAPAAPSSAPLKPAAAPAQQAAPLSPAPEATATPAPPPAASPAPTPSAASAAPAPAPAPSFAPQAPAPASAPGSMAAPQTPAPAPAPRSAAAPQAPVPASAPSSAAAPQAPVPASAPGSVPAPQVPAHSVLPAPQADPSASAPAPLSLPLPEALQGVQAAVEALVSGQPQAAQTFQRAWQALATATPSAPPPPLELAAQAAALPAPALPAFPSLPAPVQREASAALYFRLASILEAQGPQALTPTVVQAVAVQLSAEAAEPSAPLARALNLAAAAEAGSTPAPAPPLPGLPSAPQAALQAAAQELLSQPLPPQLSGPEALAQAFEARGLPAPGPALSELAPEVVYEAVALLSAKGLPPHRALVAAVAGEAQRQEQAQAPATRFLAQAAELPSGFLEWKPELRQALASVQQAAHSSGLRLEEGSLLGQLKGLADSHGFNLEAQLADIAVDASAPAPTPSLKQALLEARQALKEASADPAAAASKPLGHTLSAMAREVSQALSSLHAVQVASQPSPSVNVTTLPLPVWVGGRLEGGQLSVFWRQGGERRLDDKEPVNVVLALDTRGLGPVKVLMQVWKEECKVQVKAGDAPTADFLRAGADELKGAFEENTPFSLGSLDFSALGSAVRGALAGLDSGEAQPAPRGLSIQA